MYLDEIFAKVDALNEEVFDADSEGIKDLKDFEERDAKSDDVEIIDDEAETEKDLKKSYVGKVILDCCVCHSKIYRDKDKITVNEDMTLADEGVECPYCYQTDGYKIVGVVADFKPEEEKEVKTETEVEVKEEKLTEDAHEKEFLSRLARGNMFEFPSGDYKYVSYRDGVVFAGDIIGDRISREVEVEYDGDFDKALNDVYDKFVELHPEFMEEKLAEDKKPLKENAKDDKVMDVIGKHFNYGGDFDFYEIIKDVIDRIDNFDDENEIDEAIDDTLIYNDDIMKVYLHYNDAPELPIETIDALRDDVSAIVNELKGEELEEKCENKKEEALGNDVARYQKWVDYDMKRYGKVSEETERLLNKAGFSLVKDQYGEYEVIAKEPIHEDANKNTKTRNDNEKTWEVEEGQYLTMDEMVDNVTRSFARSVMNDEEFDEFCKKQDAKIKEHDEKQKNYGRTHYFPGCYEGHNAKPVKEGLEKVEVKTEDGDKITVKTEEEKVVVEAEKETVKPLSDEEKQEIAIDVAKENEEDVVDIDIDDFDEETFDKLTESYLKRVYNNIKGYKTEACKSKGNVITLEGKITFKSGNEKPTQFMFESVDVNGKGKVRMLGQNCQITPNKKAFTMVGDMKEKKFIAESLNYNYRVPAKKGTQRMYGTVKAGKRG